MFGRRSASPAAALLVGALALAALAAPASAATREPLHDLLAAAAHTTRAFDSAARPRPAALRAMVRSSANRSGSGGDRFEISSTHYGAAEMESVATTLRSLDHGPELSQLVVYVAAPEEITEACGAEVVACYVPSEREMVVSGVDRPVAGIPRDFAIAHEYGHHIANSLGDDYLDAGGASSASIEAGTLRWATYERVCQLTRRGRLFPGDQGAHYWQDPEEAFAQSYAQLNRPGAGVGWQYTPLLRPTAASLSKIHADVAKPWSGPVETTWASSVAAPRVASQVLVTPLDGPVSVTLRAPAGAQLAVTLHDPAAGRALASALTTPDGSAQLSYSNCGHAELQLEVRAIAGGASFQAAIARP